MKILVINGPNLNMLESRQDKYYGSSSLSAIEKKIRDEFPNHQFEFFQSNYEGAIIEKVHQASIEFDSLVINPGGFSHTSVAIKDALDICNIPKIEVHLSNLALRENFRQVMLTASSCDGYLSGFLEQGYLAAIFILEKRFKNRTHP